MGPLEEASISALAPASDESLRRGVRTEAALELVWEIGSPGGNVQILRFRGQLIVRGREEIGDMHRDSFCVHIAILVEPGALERFSSQEDVGKIPAFGNISSVLQPPDKRMTTSTPDIAREQTYQDSLHICAQFPVHKKPCPPGYDIVSMARQMAFSFPWSSRYAGC